MLSTLAVVTWSPESGRHQRCHRSRPPTDGQLEGEPATEGVARDLRGVPADVVHHRLQKVRNVKGRGVLACLQGRALAEAGQVDNDDVERVAQPRDDRILHLPPVPDAVH